MSRFAFSARFASMQGAVFLTLGVYLPFWPVWLSSRGFNADEIGMLLAVGTWVKVFSTPAISQVADRGSGAKVATIGCAVLSVAFFFGFYLAETFLAILAFQILVSLFHPPLMALTESQTMVAATIRPAKAESAARNRSINLESVVPKSIWLRR